MQYTSLERCLGPVEVVGIVASNVVVGIIRVVVVDGVGVD